MQSKVELLAPAGSMDALKAALAAGADAVYLGSALFGARAGAGFDEETLRSAIRLAHLCGRKIYVTVNTLCKQGELEAVRATLESLHQMRADAVLVQDAGVLLMCREFFPELPVHASTQMSLNNEAGARLMLSLGVKRLVLARECTLDQIALVARTGIETEVFAHGALCVAASGQCLFSAFLGGRSGNRGRCAQPCRLPYAYRGTTKAWLSPADLCVRDELPSLLNAGVSSLKIEGRLKRPEYVYIVASAYRKALDDALAGRFEPANRQEAESLTQIFARGSFTGGYISQERDAKILYPDRPTPVGVIIGRVTRSFMKNEVPLCQVLLTKTLNNGDGLEINGQSVIYSGPEVKAGETAVLRLHSAVAGSPQVRRTEDEKQLSAARAAFEGDAFLNAAALPVDAVLSAAPGVPATLTLSCQNTSVTVSGETAQAASSKPIDETVISRALKKLNGTPYTLRSLAFSCPGAYLSSASLNALRRDAVLRLSEKRIEDFEAGAAVKAAASPCALLCKAMELPPCSPPPRRLVVRTEDASELPELLKNGADFALFSPPDLRPDALNALPASFPQRCALCLPPVCGDDTLSALISLAKERALPLCLGNLGQVSLMEGQPFMADSGLPVYNGMSEKLLAAHGAVTLTLSPELSCADILSLPPAVCERLLPVYGRERLMILSHCPERVFRGLSCGREACALCAQGQGANGRALTDRLSCEYPLLPYRLKDGCKVRLFNSKPTHLLPWLGNLSPLNVSWLISFTTESAGERTGILRAYRAAMDGKTAGELSVSGTAGRFLDGVQ